MIAVSLVCCFRRAVKRCARAVPRALQIRARSRDIVFTAQPITGRKGYLVQAANERVMYRRLYHTKTPLSDNLAQGMEEETDDVTWLEANCAVWKRLSGLAKGIHPIHSSIQGLASVGREI